MRLRTLYVDLSFYCTEKKLDPSYRTKLRRQTDVLGEMIEQALKSHLIEDVSHRSIGVLAATRRRGNYRFGDGNVLRLGIAHDLNDAIDRGMNSVEAYDHLFWLIDTAFHRESDVLANHMPVLQQEYERFKEAGFQTKWVRARQKPRGQAYEFLLEATLDEHALSVDFVCKDGALEIYRECIMQTAPSPGVMFKGGLKRFEFDGSKIAISGSVPTKIPPSELSMSKHGDVKKYKGLRLTHYNWSRELKRVVGRGESE